MEENNKDPKEVAVVIRIDLRVNIDELTKCINKAIAMAESIQSKGK